MRKRRCSILSAAAVAGIDDLLIEILLRLPLKSLVRFEAVSKHWFSLINGPNFSQRRYPNPNTAPSALLLNPCSCLPYGYPHGVIRKETVGFIPLTTKTPPMIKTLSSFVNSSSGVFIIHSCNGLLLCRTDDMHFYIVNPTTKQFRSLPHPHPKPCHECSSYIFGITLAFETSSNPIHSHDHYKVVCVRYSCPMFNGYYQIEIYSSETSTWRPSGEPFLAPDSIEFDRGVFWNGAVNWVSNQRNSVYFNLNQQSLQTMPMPRRDDRIIIRYFGECGDRLQLILSEVFRSTKLDVYEMGRDYCGWCVKHRVEVDHVAATLTQKSNFLFSVLFVGDDEQDQEDESFMMLHIANHFIRYNLKDNTFHKVSGRTKSFQTNRYIRFGHLKTYQFFESLYSV